MKKLSHRWLGPLKILQQISTHAYRVDLLEEYARVHDVFHVHRLEPYKESERYLRDQGPPPPINVEGEDEWEVECIVDSRWFGRKGEKQLKFLVKWVGYVKPTWQPHQDLKHSQEALEDFYAKFPSKPRIDKSPQ